MNKEPDRRRVTVVLGEIDNDGQSLISLESTIRDARARAEKEGISELRTEIELLHGYYDSVSVSIQIVGMRDETDEEMAIRVADEQSRITDSVATRRRMYEALRQEFGE